MGFFGRFGRASKSKNERVRLHSRKKERVQCNKREEEEKVGSYGCSVFECVDAGDMNMCPADNVDILRPGDPIHEEYDEDTVSIPTIDAESGSKPMVVLDFDPVVSFDLGINSSSPKIDNPRYEIIENETEEEWKLNPLDKLSNSPAMQTRAITPSTQCNLPKKNPYNDLMEQKYNRERIERALDVLCPPCFGSVCIETMSILCPNRLTCESFYPSNAITQDYQAVQFTDFVPEERDNHMLTQKPFSMQSTSDEIQELAVHTYNLGNVEDDIVIPRDASFELEVEKDFAQTKNHTNVSTIQSVNQRKEIEFKEPGARINAQYIEEKSEVENTSHITPAKNEQSPRYRPGTAPNNKIETINSKEQFLNRAITAPKNVSNITYSIERTESFSSNRTINDLRARLKRIRSSVRHVDSTSYLERKRQNMPNLMDQIKSEDNEAAYQYKKPVSPTGVNDLDNEIIGANCLKTSLFVEGEPIWQLRTFSSFNSDKSHRDYYHGGILSEEFDNTNCCMVEKNTVISELKNRLRQIENDFRGNKAPVKEVGNDFQDGKMSTLFAI